MHIIYSHPKNAFEGIVSISKKETFAFSTIVVLMTYAVLSQVQYIQHLSAGLKGSPQLNPIDYVFMVVAVIGLYLGGRAIISPIVKKHNARMNEQLDDACSKVAEMTGIEMTQLEMVEMVNLVLIDGPKTHTEEVDNIEYTLQFSAEGDNLTISYSTVVQHKTAPVSLKTALRGGLA